MALALSLVMTDAKKAMATNVRVIKRPPETKVKPLMEPSKIKVGRPTPIKKAIPNEKQSPRN